LYFSLEKDDLCVLEELDLSDHQDPTALLEILTTGTLYEWTSGNGHAEF